MADLLQRKNLLRVVYFIAALIIIYYASSLFAAFSVHGQVDTDVEKITAGVDGFIQQVYVKDNQYVKKGTLLLTLDPTPYQLNVAAAQAVYNQAEMQVQLAQDNYNKLISAVDLSQKQMQQAQATLQRYQKLIDTKIVSPQDFELVRLKFQSTQDNLKQAQLQLLTAQHQFELNKRIVGEKAADLGTARYRLSLTKIYAPQSGYISNLNFYAGDYVKTGDMLFGFIDETAWRIVGYYYQDEISRMKPGQWVLFSLAADPWRLHIGYVDSISRGVAREKSTNDVSLPYGEPVMGWLTNNYYFPVRMRIKNLAGLPLFVGADAYTLVIY